MTRAGVAFALPVAVAGAQAPGPVRRGPAPAAPSRELRVAGQVVDSLRGGPLAGATVHRPGSPHVAITDSAGRFVLDRVGVGAGTFVVTHPRLDSLGLPGVATSVDLAAPDPRGSRPDSVAVTLATPSAATLRARLCAGHASRRGPAPAVESSAAVDRESAHGGGAAGAGGARAGDTAADGNPGVVFGEVRDAGSGARLAGAVARVRWIAVDTTRGRVAVHPEVREVRTDSLGAWVACGLPAGLPLAWRAVGDGSASGRAAVTLDRALPLARLDLWLAPGRAATGAALTPAGPAAVPATASVGDSARHGVVRGTIRDSTGAPLVGARVTLDVAEPDVGTIDGAATDGAADAARGAGDPVPRGQPGEARTGADGWFTLAGVPLGTQSLVVRALGYAPELVPVVVRGGAPAQVDVTLRRVVTLARVTARARAERRAQLAADMERRRKIGVSLTADVAVYHRTHNLGVTIGLLPYAPLRNPSGRPTPGREPCRGSLTLLDGVDMREELSVTPEEVIAIEFFRPGTYSPRWHGRLERHPCAVVALYTERWGERRRR